MSISSSASSAQIVSPSVVPPPLPSITSSSSGPHLHTPSTPSISAPPLITQGFPVVNPGTPLLLNLQPGQTVQPLTLIQSPPLGQLVRPSVGMSPVLPKGQSIQTRPGPAPSGAPVQPGSTFTAVQLPATLTIRTSTPGPGQCTGHTGGKKTELNLRQQFVTVVYFAFINTGKCHILTLAGVASRILGVVGATPWLRRFSPRWKKKQVDGNTPADSWSTPVCLGLIPPQLHSNPCSLSTVSVSPGLAASGPTPCVITAPCVTSAPTSDPPRVVMSVEEFYYGTFEGDLSLRKPHPLGIKTSTFTCQICSHLTENNLRLMQHMLQHSELTGGGGDDRKCCKFCYRQFSSPAQLQNHQEQVHGPAFSSSMCRICEWAFENEPAFLNHMKSNHKPGEMPYICQVCSYRSSFYSDVTQHFASFHRDSRFLLCVFCLKVTRNPASYQQHLLRHQINQAFHCNRCRLQFVFLKDKMQHKLENHRSFRRPALLEGLPPGQSTSRQSRRSPRSRNILSSPSPNHPPPRGQSAAESASAVKCSCPPSCRSSSCDGDRLVCLECGTDASDFSAHYPTHVHCLLCPYSSCCSRAYAAHMIHSCRFSHCGVVSVWSCSPFLLQCSQCAFTPQTADQMADHLLMNPEHHSGTCHDERMDDLDETHEEAEDIKEEFIKEFKPLMSQLPTTTNSHAQPAAILSACKERDDSFTARQLRIALLALCDGLRQASRVFSTDMQLIRMWLKEAKQRFKHTEQEQKVHTDGGDRMVAWVLSMREQQLPITESSLFHKASTLKKKGGFSDSFRISYDWAVSFRLQHRLGIRTIGRAATLARTLPASLEAKVTSFREFTQKIIQDHQLSESTVAAMDELCLFVDLRSVQDKSRRSQALELTGSLPLVTVYLTALADGTMLPSLVLANGQLAKTVLPEFILLEASPDSLLVEEALDLWTNKVWLRHLSGPTQPSKSMLVLDRHREHMGDQFFTSISGSGTLPAVIPGGCSFCLQPLEVCVKPVLQRFLLSRWAKFTAGNPKELEDTSPHRLQVHVAQLLLDWVVEALTHLNKLPQLWKKSFHLTGLQLALKTEDGAEEETSQKPGEIQSSNSSAKCERPSHLSVQGNAPIHTPGPEALVFHRCAVES
uniref:Pogo transposable element derived with ZNF domain b n=1 Tax=Monopterus albus TaxID=43700 RepID=A0A3Q3JR94_MONAL